MCKISIKKIGKIGDICGAFSREDLGRRGGYIFKSALILECSLIQFSIIFKHII